MRLQILRTTTGLAKSSKRSAQVHSPVSLITSTPSEPGQNQHMDYIRSQRSATYKEYQAELDRCARRTYKTVFTHEDLAPHNILVKGGKIVAIIDWEFAGWYPEYWEYTRACLGNIGMSDWCELFSSVGADVPYPDELVVEHVLSLEFVRC